MPEALRAAFSVKANTGDFMATSVMPFTVEVSEALPTALSADALRVEE